MKNLFRFFVALLLRMTCADTVDRILTKIKMVSSTEIKVGFVFFIGLGLLAIFTIMVGQGELGFYKKGYCIDVLFDSVGGLRKNDAVELAGMKVGKVESLRNEGEWIRVRLQIDDGVQIQRDSKIVIMEKSLLGGRTVSISIGKDPKIIPPGTTLIGKKLSGTTELIAKASNIGEKLENTLLELEKAIPELTSTLKSVSSITTSIKEGKGTLGKLVTGEEIGESLEKTLKGMEEVGPKMISTLESIKRITKKIEEGKGTIGKLAAEEELYEDVSETLRSARVAADEVAKFTERIEKLKTYVGLDSAYNEDNNRILTKVYVRIEPQPHKLYLVGGSALTGTGTEWDEKDESDLELDLQLGRRFFDNKLTGRIGLFETRVGAGIDLRLNNRLSLSIEGRDTWTREKDEDVEPFLLRSRIRCRIWRGFYVHAGADNILDEPAINAGITLEYSDEDIKYVLGAMSIGT